MTRPPRGYSASKDELIDRLSKAEGQVRGVARMVEEDRYCIDIVTQIGAVQAALDKIALALPARRQGRGQEPRRSGR